MLARDGKSTQLRLLVPTPLCGTIIGKGGATIRSFAEDSGAAITVSPQDKQPLGIPDRCFPAFKPDTCESMPEHQLFPDFLVMIAETPKGASQILC